MAAKSDSTSADTDAAQAGIAGSTPAETAREANIVKSRRVLLVTVRREEVADAKRPEAERFPDAPKPKPSNELRVQLQLMRPKLGKDERKKPTSMSDIKL